jgi:hypothetical protein
MSLLSFFSKKKPRGNSFEDDEIRQRAIQHSKEIRELNAQIREAEHQASLEKARLILMRKQQAIQDYRDEITPPEPEPGIIEQLQPYLPLILSLLSGKQLNAPELLNALNNSPQQQHQAQLSPPKKDDNSPGVAYISDEEIKQTIEQIPKKDLKMAKMFPDSVVKSYLQKHFSVDNETADRALTILRTT